MLRLAITGLTMVVFAATTIPAAAASKAKTPEAGAVFQVSDATPKYVTAEIEFRDPAGKLWPNFAYGKPGGQGTFTYDPQHPKAALVLSCDHMAQTHGDQSRRVLGEAIVNGQSPLITFTVLDLGETKTVTRTEADAKGKTKTIEEQLTDVRGELKIGDRKVPVKGLMKLSYSDRDNTVFLSFRCTIKGNDIGFQQHIGPIDVVAGVTAFGTLPEASKK